MSNLKLPTMTIENLKRIHPRDGSIGYKTDITWNADKTKVGIYHHNSLISVIDESGIAGYERVVSISMAGWSSKATIDRLNRILRANTTKYFARIKNYTPELACNDIYGGYALDISGDRFYSIIHSDYIMPSDSAIITDGSIYNGVH